MSILIGTVFSRGTKKQEGQHVASKLFFLGLPWGVVNTFLVTARDGNGVSGLKLKTQYKTLLHWWLWIAGLILLTISIVGLVEWFSYQEDSGYLMYSLMYLIPAIIIAWGIYKLIAGGKTTPYEKFVREQFHKTMGFYVMPEWLQGDTFDDFHNAMREHYIKVTNNTNWREALNNLVPGQDGFAISFCLSYMDNLKNNEKTANKALVEHHRNNKNS